MSLGLHRVRQARLSPSLAPRIPRRHMRIIPVPVREDNYAYIVMSTPKGARPQGAFVDPYDVPTVRRAAHTLGLQDTDIVGSLSLIHI